MTFLNVNIKYESANNITIEDAKTKQKVDASQQDKIKRIIENISRQNPRLSIASIDIRENEQGVQIRVQARNGYSFEVKNQELSQIAHEILLGQPRKKMHATIEKPEPQGTPFPRLHDRLPPPTPKILAHVHADEFGAGSELQGESEQLASLQFLAGFMQSMPDQELRQYGLDKQKIAFLDDAMQFNEKLLDPDNGLKALEEALSKNREVLIGGGWYAMPAGHQMYYQVIPERDGRYTMRIFNLGAGISGRHFEAQVGEKSKVYPIVEWKGIERTRLASQDFLNVLREMNDVETIKRAAKYGVDYAYSQEDVYRGLRELLKPAEESKFPSDMANLFLMTPQRSGYCAWKGLLAVLRSQMGPDEYKRLKAHIKMQSLLSFVNSHQQNIDPRDYQLVHKSLMKLSRSLLKMKEDNIVDNAYIQKAYEALGPVDSWVKKNKASILQQRAQEPSPAYSKPHLEYPQGLEESHVTPLSTSHPTGDVSQRVSGLAEEIQSLRFDDPQSLQVNIGKALQLLSGSWDKKQDLEVHVALKGLIGNLTLNEILWQNLGKDPQTGKRLIEDLAKLQQLLLRSYFAQPDAKIRQPDAILCGLKVVYIQHQLCRGLFGEKWAQVKPVDREMVDLFCGEKRDFAPHQSNLDIQLFDGTKDRELQTILKWLNEDSSIAFNPGQKRSSWYGEQDASHKSTMHNIVFNADGKTSIVDVLCDIDPEIRSKFAAKDPKFGLLPKHEQDAYIFASKDVPEWFKSIRDSYFCSQFLAYDPVGPATVADRHEKFSADFHAEKSQRTNEMEVTFFLTGYKLPVEPSINGYSRIYPAYTDPTIADYHQRLNVYSKVKSEHIVSNTGARLGTYYGETLPRPQIEEYKNLGIHCVQQNLKAVGLIEFLAANTEKFNNPEYQTLFQRLLFENGTLLESLRLEGFLENVQHLLAECARQSVDENRLQKAVFFLRMSRYISHYQRTPPSDNISKLKDLLKIEGLAPKEKSLICLELTAALSAKTELNAQDVRTLVMARSIHRRYPIPDIWQNAYLRKEFEDSFFKHAKSIQKHLMAGDTPNQGLLNDVLKETYPNSSQQQWKLSSKAGEYPVFKSADGKCLFYPIQGEMILSGQSALLPERVTKHSSFQKLFPDVKEAAQHDLNLFSFKDKNGIETEVSLEGTKMIIQQKRTKPSKERVTYIDPSMMVTDSPLTGTITPNIGSYNLINSYHAWLSLKSPHDIILTDPSTGNVKFTVTRDNSGPTAVVRSKDDATLGEPSSLLKEFEDGTYIHEWYRNKQLTEIELPRFGLSFKAGKEKPPQLHCDQFPGFHLKPNAAVNALGAFRQHIVLEDEKGNQKILVPEWRFTKPEKQEVFTHRYNVEREISPTDSKPQIYHVFDVKDGKLSTKSRASNLYAAQAMLLVQDYKKAGAFLRAFGPKLEPYTEQELNILRNLASTTQVTGDIDGNAIALQLYAHYLLRKNAREHPKEQHNIQTESDLLTTYSDYLSHYHNATLFKLQPQEELYLLHLVKDSKPEFTARWQELSGQARVPAESTSSHPLPELGNRGPTLPREIKLSLDAFREIEHYNRRPENLMDLPVSRLFYPPSQLSNLRLYETALTGNPQEKERLRNGLLMARTYMDKVGNPVFLHVLERALESPQDFPPLPSPITPNALDGWMNQVSAIANEKVAKALQPEAPTQLRPPVVQHDFTPDDYRLDRTRENVPPFRVEARILPEERTVAKLAKTGGKAWLSTQLPASQPLRPPSKKSADWKERIPFISSQLGKVQKSLHGLLTVTVSAPEPELLEPPKTPVLKLQAFFESQSVQDPLERKEYARLAADNAHHLARTPAPQYSASPEGLKDMAAQMQRLKTDNEKQMGNLREEIMDLARKGSLDDASKAVAGLMKMGGVTRPLKWGELIVNFGVQNPSQLILRNPALTQEDAQLLYNKIAEYLMLATAAQQATRGLGIIDKIQQSKDDPNEVNDLVQQLGSEITTERCYDPQRKPAFLVFEFFADFMLRSKQASMIDDYLQYKDANYVMEMIMGSGKSSVLLPLLGLLRADGTNISMLVVPDPLFSSVSGDMQAVLRDSFGVQLHTLHFDRDTPTDALTLTIILEELQQVRQNKECIIMTSKTISCLILKYIDMAKEHYNRVGAEAPPSRQLEAMRDILSLLSTSGIPLLDEVDQLLNALKEVSFSTGKPHPPEQYEMDLITNLYDVLYSDPAIKAAVQFESDPHPAKGANVLTPQNYDDVLKPLLIQSLLNNFQQIELEDKNLQNQFRNFFQNLKEPDKMAVIAYLSRDENRLDEAQVWFNRQPKSIRNMLALLSEEINRHLPLTLNQHCDEKYGIDVEKGGVLGMPFSAANKPTRGSQFINHHITMNYTLQSYMKKGVTLDILKSQIALLEKLAREEINQSEGQKKVSDTSAWKTFMKLKGNLNIPLVNMSDAQMDLLLNHINQSPQIKLDFVRTQILPQIEIFDRKISINPVNLMAFFKNVSGFTGTLWNSASMHRKITPKPSAGTDALTLNLLWERSQDKVRILQGATPEEMLREISLSGKSFDMVCDAGGYLKECNNEENAKLLCKVAGKPVVYFDASGKIMVWDGKKNTPIHESTLKEEERLTLLDQSHTTGANIRQKRDAVGYVTIGHKMLLRDLLQSVWRLRGIEKSQRVEFLLSRDTETIIRQTLKLKSSEPITFKEILQFVVRNQAQQQGKENYRAFIQELEDIPQTWLLKVLLDPHMPESQKARALDRFGSFWEKSAYSDPESLYGSLMSEQPSEAVIREKAEGMKKMLSDSGIQSLTMLEDIDNIVKRYVGALPKTLSTKPDNDEMTMEMEQQQEMEMQAEREMETESMEFETQTVFGEILPTDNNSSYLAERIDDAMFAEWKAAKSANSYAEPRLSIPMISLSEFFTRDPETAGLARAFEGVTLSLNLFQWDEQNPKASDMKLFGPHRRQLKYFRKEGGKLSAISTCQASKMLTADPGQVYNLQLGALCFGPEAERLQNKPEYLYDVVRLKFLNGESSFSKKELEVLQKWLIQNDPIKMRDFFIRHVLSGQMVQKNNFLMGSSLQRLFSQLIESHVPR